jgi:cobalt-zinc-cadmium efflux system outer membrane protein
MPFKEKAKTQIPLNFPMAKCYWLLVISFLFASHFINAQTISPLTQDTVYLTIPDAEQRFVSKNLTLLMSNYDVSIAKDNYLQAKLWYNPNLTYTQEAYNPYTKELLNANNENAFQLQELLTIGGRHSAYASLNKIGVKQAQFQLADVLRGLKYQLYTDISDLYNNQQMVAMYKSEEGRILPLIDATRQLYKAGNASGNDLIRLQAQYQDAVAQEVTSQQAVYNDQNELKTMLVYPAKTYLVIREIGIPMGQIPPFQSILDSAQKNRPDLLLASTGVSYQKQNVKLQKRTGVPDLTLGVAYDKAGSYEPNFWGIYGSMDLPVFNRNQGNVKVAKDEEKKAELNDSLALYTVQNEVTSNFCILYRLNNQYLQIDANYENDLNEMMDNAVKNYDKRYISLLDLLSQINTYIDGKTNLLNLKVHYFNAIHSINYSTGIDMIK